MGTTSATGEPFLTLVIPAYNEANRLPESLRQIGEFLRARSFRSEILVVENGSTDRTSAVVIDYSESLPIDSPFEVRLLHSLKGKGAAVRTGMLAGRGEVLFICDADLSMPIEELGRFLPPELLAGTFDVAIASRELPGSVRYDEPYYRHVMGRVFNLIVRLLIVPGIQDTQCGFKLFTANAVSRIFPYLTIGGWGFDPEALWIARARGLRLIEIPVHWYYKTESRVRPLHDTFAMLREVLRVRRNGRLGRYDERVALSDSPSSASD